MPEVTYEFQENIISIDFATITPEGELEDSLHDAGFKIFTTNKRSWIAQPNEARKGFATMLAGLSLDELQSLLKPDPKKETTQQLIDEFVLSEIPSWRVLYHPDGGVAVVQVEANKIAADVYISESRPEAPEAASAVRESRNFDSTEIQSGMAARAIRDIMMKNLLVGWKALLVEDIRLSRVEVLEQVKQELRREQIKFADVRANRVKPNFSF